MIKHKQQTGFTLLEMLLVLAIMGGVLILALNYGTRQAAQQRRDKTALQMQQILNAGLAYYTSYGSWPVPSGTCSFASTSTSNATLPSSLTTLTGSGYLPSSVSSNPFGFSYKLACDSVTGGVFYVITQFNNKANALIVAGEMPVAYLSDQYGNASTSGLYVTAQVTIPGQNLNNARSVNFAGIYHHGACVPVPSCPGYSTVTRSCNSGTNCMTPQIMVSPTSVSGVSDSGSTNVYPITSFTAFAYGPATNPKSCLTGTATSCSIGTGGVASPSGLYWRVCLQVITGKGIVSTTNTSTGSSAWGQYVSMMAVTRCAPPSEPIGSDFTVFTQ